MGEEKNLSLLVSYLREWSRRRAVEEVARKKNLVLGPVARSWQDGYKSVAQRYPFLEGSPDMEPARESPNARFLRLVDESPEEVSAGLSDFVLTVLRDAGLGDALSVTEARIWRRRGVLFITYCVGETVLQVFLFSIPEIDLLEFNLPVHEHLRGVVIRMFSSVGRHGEE